MKYFTLIFLCMAILSCGKTNKLTTNNTIPLCTQKLIDSATGKPKGAIFTKIESYLYQDKTVYLFTAGCCDRYNEVKDENCKYLFSPSGGLTGKGDGKQPNLMEAFLIFVGSF